MRAAIKGTTCPLCSSLLVFEDGTITCETGCKLDQKAEWNKETAEKLLPLFQWYTEQTGKASPADPREHKQ